MEGTNKARDEITSEVEEMVHKQEFRDMKDEFSSLTKAYAEKTQKTEDDAWDMVTAKIVEFLPYYLTEGLLKCSLETIFEQDACQKAVKDNQKKLTISPSDKFPSFRFPTFYPYLEFILRAGPVDIWKTKKTFKVEGSMSLKETTIRFTGHQIESISGTILVSMKISLCKGKFPAKIHQFDKQIHVT